MIANMTGAIPSTKLPILLENGSWDMVHESRTDGSMLLGAGPWSVDANLSSRARPREV